MRNLELLLEKRGLTKCPLPLWKLKMTDDEYDNLKNLLKKRTYDLSGTPFRLYKRECALFFAEYWRREYKEGRHSKQMVYDALGSTIRNESLIDDFYAQAVEGSEILGIEQYDGRKADHLNSMLYQGGLPMSLVVQSETNSVWDRFTRGLVNKRINFEELDLGLVAIQSQSLKEYCYQLINAIETERYSRMPFHCNDEFDSWYVNLINLSKQEKRKQRQLHPFSLDWEFKVNSIEKKISAKYVIKGSQKLPVAFLEQEGLEESHFFSIFVKVNGLSKDTFDYLDGYCRYPIVSKHTYKIGDVVSLSIHENEVPHIVESLDMSIPHILYRDSDGVYKLGNHIGEYPSLLLFDDIWKVKDESQFDIKTYAWNDTQLKGIELESGFTDVIILSSDDDEISFGANTPMYWTKIVSNPLCVPGIEESLYAASKCKFKLCFDTDDGFKSISNPLIQFRSKWARVWTDTPEIGCIFVRAKDTQNHFVTPIQLINIGEEPIINFQNADKDSCDIRIEWKYGLVFTNDGTKKDGDRWHITKKSCINNNRILFTFIPNENINNEFTLTIKVPFKDFAIYDSDGEPIETDIWIPYSDLDKYQYHLVGQNIKEYSFGKYTRELRWNSDKLNIMEHGRILKTIPYEGSLLTLFDSRENVRALLDRTSKDMLTAEVPVVFKVSNTECLRFGIKESPLRPIQTSDGKIIVTGKGHKEVNFRGSFKLLKLDEPEINPEVLSYDHQNGYVIPEKIYSWGKTILVGRTRGRICPTLVDMTRDMDAEYRRTTRENAISSIVEDLKKSHFEDHLWLRIMKWYKCIQDEDIPAGSILELYCLARHPDYLIGLAFQLFAQCDDADDRDTIANQLLQLSNDLAFQWYWMRSRIDGICFVIQKFINDNDGNYIKKMVVRWALRERENTEKYLALFNDEQGCQSLIDNCLYASLSEFSEWLKELCIKSMLDSYEVNAKDYISSTARDIVENKSILINYVSNEYIEYNQDDISETTESFFEQYDEQHVNGHEQWLFRRINAVAANLKEKENLFAQSDEVRRSIIFCAKSCNEQFIINLNNKLTK